MKIEFKNLVWVAMAFVGGFGVHAMFFSGPPAPPRSAQVVVSGAGLSWTSSVSSTPPVVLRWESAPPQDVGVSAALKEPEKMERRAKDPGRFDVLPGFRPVPPGTPRGHDVDLFDQRSRE